MFKRQLLSVLLAGSFLCVRPAQALDPWLFFGSAVAMVTCGYFLKNARILDIETYSSQLSKTSKSEAAVDPVVATPVLPQGVQALKYVVESTVLPEGAPKLQLNYRPEKIVPGNTLTPESLANHPEVEWPLTVTMGGSETALYLGHTIFVATTATTKSPQTVVNAVQEKLANGSYAKEIKVQFQVVGEHMVFSIRDAANMGEYFSASLELLKAVKLP